MLKTVRFLVEMNANTFNGLFDNECLSYVCHAPFLRVSFTESEHSRDVNVVVFGLCNRVNGVHVILVGIC